MTLTFIKRGKALFREGDDLTAEQVELERRVQRLESRSRVVPEARRRLGMRMPDAREIMILPGAEL